MMLTIREVADKVRLSEKTIRRLIKRGELVAYRVGDRGQLRVKAADLERYLEGQRVRATSPPGPCDADAAPAREEGPDA